MANEFAESFVGREKEIGIFKEMLSSGSEKEWILNIKGGGGIGKTKLLKKIAGICDQEIAQGAKLIRTRRLIDFYETSNRRRVGLLRNLSRQLGEENFADFATALARSDALRHPEVSMDDEEELKVLEREVHSQFDNCYRRLAADRLIVLLFDTFEEAGEVSDWLLGDLLPRTEQNSIVVIAGREEIDWPERQKGVKTVCLREFTCDEAIKYFRSRGLKNRRISGDAVEKIRELAEGQPLLIALACDWILEGRNPSELVGETSRSDFKKSLVKRIVELGKPEDWVVLLMAHLYRRFGKEILAYLLKEDVEECERMLGQLSRLSFVKYREPSNGFPGSCLLHDEMRHLVKKYVWSDIDPSGDTQRGLSHDVLGYYERRIKAGKDKRERQALQAERLFYELDTDLEKAWKTFVRLFDEEAIYRYELGFCQLLLNEIWEYADRLQERKALIDLRKANLLVEQEDTDGARKLYRVVSDRLPLDGKERAEALFGLGRCAAIERNYKEAAAYYDESLRIYRKEEDWVGVGKVLNYSGLAKREQGRLDEAHADYQESLAIRLRERDARGVAQTMNNIGNVCRLKGKFKEALDYCLEALHIRKQLDNKLDTGKSCNTIAMVYRDMGEIEKAISFHERAIKNFKEVQANSWLAQAYASLGYAYYRNRDWERALEHLRESMQIAEQLPHQYQFPLCSALNKIARVYSNQEKWEAAETSFRESLKLARECGERYYEMDNLVGFCVLYQRQGRFDEIPGYERQVRKLVDQGYKFEYLLGRLEQVLGNVAWEKGEHEAALDDYLESCAHMAQFNPLRYNEVLDILEQRLRELPQERIPVTCNDLIDKWQGHGLADDFPQLIVRCRRVEIQTRFPSSPT